MTMPLHTLVFTRARRASGWIAVAITILLLGSSAAAEAATARVRWLPVANATRYNVYVRNAGTAYGAVSPMGSPTTGGDGTMSANITYTPGSNGNNYFTVTAVAPDGAESGISGELPIEEVDPCDLDQCSTRTSCQFGTQPNGTACDDQAFCNGHETCLNGTCTAGSATSCSDGIACTVDSCDENLRRCNHAGPPGCCVACDGTDPCLAEACAAGDCQAPAGTELTVGRLRMQRKASGVKLAAKSMFIPAAGSDPTASGATIQILAPDGTVLYASDIAASSFKVRTGGRFRFSATRAQSELLSNGITRFDIRTKRINEWHITLKAETPLLDEAFFESSLTWMIRVGSDCARRRSMTCEPGETRSSCL
jgi:hypothetical protein